MFVIHSAAMLEIRHGICQMFYTNKFPIFLILLFWQKVENWGCSSHKFWTNCYFLLLKYELTPAILWKATTSLDSLNTSSYTKKEIFRVNSSRHFTRARFVTLVTNSKFVGDLPFSTQSVYTHLPHTSTGDIYVEILTVVRRVPMPTKNTAVWTNTLRFDISSEIFYLDHILEVVKVW